ncbi:hypothetical protein [Metabacillus halosaccharovorans]|uniref:hypothetical protein n=1 Tax=Metabacillus halosaccharovorans TaxID=930124 RepID=UPI001C1FED61|nr:hypothetical protein [Metabacillus halosaccharovorans]MBU7594885.1 hypothetical protein [Metabacillus halosaccharovorans]
MLKNKKLLFLSLILFVISIALNFPFPHKYPYGEAVASILNIPIQMENGLHIVGITSLLFLITSLFFLSKSFKKHKGRFVLLGIVCALFLPHFLADTYQKTFTTGIYAISYEVETSECSFDMISDNTMKAICEFSFINNSRDNVSFDINFYEAYLFEEDVKMLSLLGINAPYKVEMTAKEGKQVKIETIIDVSNIKNHVDSGTASHVNIIIQAGEKIRRL